MISHGDTLVVHSMTMVLAVRFLCVLKSSLKIYDRRLLILSGDVLVEEV